MILTWAALIAFASYRVWRLAALDQITEPLRAVLVEREGRFSGWVLDLVGCAWCLGFWISGAVTLATAHHLGWDWPVALLTWGAASTGVGLLGKTEDFT